MPGDLAFNSRQLISYLMQISSASDLASLNPYLSNFFVVQTSQMIVSQAYRIAHYVTVIVLFVPLSLEVKGPAIPLCAS